MKHKRLLSMLLAVVMTLSLLPVVAFADYWYYVDRYWDESSKEVVSNEVDIDPSTLMPEGSSFTFLTNGTDMFFVIDDTTFADRWTISGDIKLVIADGATLTCEKGIAVNHGASLSIYGQRNDSGKLIANSDSYNAAIGSDGDENGCGAINIYGGTINATGGRRAAGIGGGNEAGNGAVNIYGGTVKAQGGDSGAGIGTGDWPETKAETIKIYGGNVTANGGNYGAGIGGGDEAGNGAIVIYGGTVTAQGGDGGAGIGTGDMSATESGTITIYGGTINAIGGYDAAGIGGGDESGNGAIAIYGGTVKAQGGDSGAGIASEKRR